MCLYHIQHEWIVGNVNKPKPSTSLPNLFVLLDWKGGKRKKGTGLGLSFQLSILLCTVPSLNYFHPQIFWMATPSMCSYSTFCSKCLACFTMSFHNYHLLALRIPRHHSTAVFAVQILHLESFVLPLFYWELILSFLNCF